MGTIVFLYFSNSCSIISSTSFSWLATLVCSHGSLSMLNKQGPSLWPHSAGLAGGGGHVTIALFKEGLSAAESEKFNRRDGFCWKPGGGYQPSLSGP